MEVLKAINAVQAALVMTGGIGKDRKNQAQGYSFRGIDDMYNTLAPMLATSKLLIIPHYSERQVVERENKHGTALFYVTVTGHYTFRHAEDGSEIKVGPFYGEAMDSGDKATNKAMSAALKYALMQTFTIPTEGDNDTENQTHEVAPKRTITPTTGAWESQTPDMQDALQQFAVEVSNLVASGSLGAALEAIEAKETTWWQDEMAKVAFWSRLDKTTRGKLKRAKEEASMQAAVQRQKEAA